MKKLMTANSLGGIDVALAKGRLDAEGIACFIRNEALSWLVGELPPVYQELWVYDDAQFERAREILETIPDPSRLPEDSET